MVSLPVKGSQGCSFFGWKVAASQTRPLLVIFPHSTVHSQVHFLRPTYSTCTQQNTLLCNFPSSAQHKYKALFPLKPLRKPSLFPLDMAAELRFFFKSSWVLMSGVKKGDRLHISIFHPCPTVWFHTTHCFTKQAHWAQGESQKALMHSYSDPPVCRFILTSTHPYTHPYTLCIHTVHPQL